MSVTEQALVLTKWVNSVLKKKMHQIANLETGFVTGLELAALVELLSNKTIPGLNPSPKNRSQKLQNNQTVLHWLQREERLPIPSKVTAEELVDGNVKHVVALLWELALYYQIGNNQLQPQQPPKKKGSSRKSKNSLQDTKRLRLLAELNVFLKDSSFLPITNFEEAFNDGTILSSLLGRMKQVDGVSAAMMLRTSNGEAGEGRSGIVSKRTIANSIALLYRHFDVPPLLEAEDLAKGRANELMVMLYISVCLQQLKSYEENVQLRAGAKEYSTATTEGDFDQLNDKLQLGKDLENKLDKDIEKVLQKLRDDQGSHRGSKKYRKGKKNRTQAKSPTLPRWNSEEAAKQQSEGTDIHAAGTPIAAGRKRRGTFMAEAIGRHLPEATKERHRSATISSIHGYPSLPEDLQEDIKAIRKRNKARKKALKEVKKKAPNTKKLLALASGGGLTKEELKVTLEELSRRDGVTEEKAILRDILQRTIEREEQERLKRTQQERKGSSGLEPLGPMMAMGGTVEERTRFMLEQHMGIQFQQKRYENADPTTDKTGTGEKGTDSDDSDDSDDTPTEATDLSDLRLDTLALRVARNQQQGPRTIFNLWEEAGMSPEEADVDVFAGSEPNTPRSSDPSNKETTEDTSTAARLQITIATLNTPDDPTPSNAGTTSPPPLPPRAVASAELRQRSATAIPASKVTPTVTKAKVAIGTNGSTDTATPVPIPSQQAFKKPGTKPSFTPQPLTPTKQESTLSSKEPTKKGKSYRHPSPSNSKNATPPPLSIPLSTAVAVSTSSCAHTTAKFVAHSKELEQSMPEWDFRWETAMLNPTMKDENMMLDDTLRCFVVASKAVVAAAQELRDAAHTEAHKQAISGAAKEFGQATVHFIHVFKELIHCMKRRQVPPPSQEQQLLNKDIASRYSAGRMTITAKLHALTKVIAAAIESRDQSPEMIRRRAGTTPSSISPQITDHSAPLASPRVAPSISPSPLPCPSSTSSVPQTVPTLNLPVLDATIHHQRPHSYRGPSPNRTTSPAIAAVASTPRPPPVASRQPCTPLSRLMTHSRSLSTTSAPSSPRLISPLSPPTPRTQRDASSSSSINESMGAGRRRMISLLQSLDASLFAPRSSSFADTSIKDTVAALTGTAKQLLMDGKSLAGEAASMHFQEETCQSILRLCQEFGTQVTELRSFLLQRESGNADALAANKAKVLLALENLIIGAGPVLDALQQTAQQPQLTARSKKKKTFLEYTKKVNQGLSQISSMCKFDDDEEEEMLFDTDAFRQRVFALVATIQKAATILVEGFHHSSPSASFLFSSLLLSPLSGDIHNSPHHRPTTSSTAAKGGGDAGHQNLFGEIIVVDVFMARAEWGGGSSKRGQGRGLHARGLRWLAAGIQAAHRRFQNFSCTLSTATITCTYFAFFLIVCVHEKTGHRKEERW